MPQELIIENEFYKVDQIKKARKSFSDLTDCPEILIKVYVQGYFKIVNRSMWTNELNLDYGWHEVREIKQKYIKVYIPSEKKSFKVSPYINEFRKPGFRLVAEVLNNLTFRY